LNIKVLQKVKDCTIFHFLYYIDFQWFTFGWICVLKDRILLLFHVVPIHLRCFKFILMKKLFMFLMALLLPLFALGMSADDENAKMKIPLRMVSW